MSQVTESLFISTSSHVLKAALVVATFAKRCLTRQQVVKKQAKLCLPLAGEGGHRGSLRILAILAASIVTGLGCDRDPMIRVYDVPRESITSRVAKVPPDTLAPMAGNGMTPASGSTGMSSQVPSGPRRFLIAVIPQESSVVFIKANDRPELLDALVEPLRSFALSFEFNGPSQKPAWTLPDGWVETEATDGVAMAKILAPITDAIQTNSPTKKVIEFTLSQLPKPSSRDAWPAYFEQNVNRWRKQLGLPPSTLAEASSPNNSSSISELLRKAGELPAYIVDLKNELPISSPSPDSNRKGTVPSPMIGSNPMAPPDSSTPRTASKLQYIVPDGWADEGSRGMRAASFSIPASAANSKSSGEVTVIFAGGDKLANVVRWQGQVAPSKTDEEKQSAAEQAIANAIDVQSANGQSGQLYVLRGSNGDSQATETDPPMMLAAILPMENDMSSVFIKLTAPASLAREHQQRLIDFIRSLAW